MLQCPTCEARHSLETVEPGSTFDCSGCGRTLRAPSAPAPDAASDPTGVAPVASPAAGGDPSGSRAAKRRAAAGAHENAAAPAAGFPIAVRIGAWVVAVVVSGLVAVWLARAVGLLTADNLVDVITGSGSGRYVRLGVLALLWAVLATGLVTLLIDGGWRLLSRRAGGPTPARVTADPDPSAPMAAAAPTAAPMPARSTDQRPRRIPPRDTGA
jgi:hypothetical protein